MANLTQLFHPTPLGARRNSSLDASGQHIWTPSGGLLGQLLSANMNVTTDQAIRIESTKWIVRKIVVTNASISLDTAVGGLYDTVSKGGIDLVKNDQVYSALTAPEKFVDLTLEAECGTQTFAVPYLYFALTTAQGVAARADIYVYGDVIIN